MAVARKIRASKAAGIDVGAIARRAMAQESSNSATNRYNGASFGRELREGLLKAAPGRSSLLVILGDEEAFGFHLREDLCNILLQLVAADHDDFQTIHLDQCSLREIPLPLPHRSTSGLCRVAIADSDEVADATNLRGTKGTKGARVP